MPLGYAGGKSEGLGPWAFDPVQLHRGTEVEMEHTRSRKIAQRIAMDHLVEDPAYYQKLAKIHLDGFDITSPKGLRWTSLGLAAYSLLTDNRTLGNISWLIFFASFIPRDRE